MRGIITVIGKDKVGIIGKICILLSDNNVNILDISQTILQEYLNMLMIVDFSTSKVEFNELSEKLEQCAKELNMEIKLQHEDIFDCMHRV